MYDPFCAATRLFCCFSSPHCLDPHLILSLPSLTLL